MWEPLVYPALPHVHWSRALAGGWVGISAAGRGVHGDEHLLPDVVPAPVAGKMERQAAG